MKISIVIPVYNGALTIESVIDEIEKTIGDCSYEVILVDDCSQDDSFRVIETLALKDSRLKVIKLKNNVGQQNATFTGLNYVTGDYIVTMDDDFQHDFSYFHEMKEKIDQGMDLVYGLNKNPDGKNLKGFGGKLRDIFFNRTFKTHDLKRVSSFRVFRGDLKNDILKNDYRFIYLSSILLRLTNKVDYIYYEKRKRLVGHSNYSFFRLFKLFINLFYYYSPFIPETMKPKGNGSKVKSTINVE